MIQYKDFRPTAHDAKGLGLDDRQDWLVLGVAHNRDSSVLEESNWAMALEDLGGESDTVEVHRFGHWGPGWFELILVAPGSQAAEDAEAIEAALADYPVLSDDDYSERCLDVANQVWKDCYNNRTRLEYMAKHWSEFDFRCFSDMLGCARGHYFAGDAMSMAEGC